MLVKHYPEYLINFSKEYLIEHIKALYKEVSDLEIEVDELSEERQRRDEAHYEYRLCIRGEEVL